MIVLAAYTNAYNLVQGISGNHGRVPVPQQPVARKLTSLGQPNRVKFGSQRDSAHDKRTQRAPPQMTLPPRDTLKAAPKRTIMPVSVASRVTSTQSMMGACATGSSATIPTGRDARGGIEGFICELTAESSGRVVLARGDAANFEGDALLCAANEKGVGGGGVDGAVNKLGGPVFVAQREALPLSRRDVRIPIGGAVAIRACGALAVDWVVLAELWLWTGSC